MSKSKRPDLPALYADTVKRPPRLPDAMTLRQSGLPLSKSELDLVRAAMAVHASSRQPKLTWQGWKLIGAALEIAEAHVKKAADGQTTGRAYNQMMGEFLRASGLVFINKGVRWALRQCMAQVETIDEWRTEIPDREREHLHNPVDVLDQFNRRNTSTTSATPKRPKLRPVKRAHHDHNNLLEYCIALEERIAELEEQRDRLQDMHDRLQNMAQHRE